MQIPEDQFRPSKSASLEVDFRNLHCNSFPSGFMHIKICNLKGGMYREERKETVLTICTLACSLSCVWLFATSWTVAHQAPLSMGFSKQEYWSGVPFPPLEDLPNPGIEPVSPAWQADFLPLSHLGNPGGIPIYLNPVCLSSGVMCNLPCRRVIHACSLSSDKAVCASGRQMWAEVTSAIPLDVRYMVYHISIISQVEAVLSVWVLE